MNNFFDVVGVGFGPSNLSLAIALQEHKENSDKSLRTAFFEQKAEFSWFPDMLLEGATMQVSFLKDLVTLRNPRSSYSFLNYLQHKGRLEKFVNLRDWFPTRIEFNDYFTWAADHFQSQVHYEHKIISIEPSGTQPTETLRVISQNSQTETISTCLTRNLVLALGGRPVIPPCVRRDQDSKRIWHNSNFLPKIAAYDKDKAHHFAVIGSGQSAAEICKYLYSSYPHAKITVIMRAFGFRAADDTEFVNEIFSSDSIDLFFRASDNLRHELLHKLSNTNYTVVDPELIKTLYHLHYNDLVSGQPRLNMVNLTSLLEAQEFEDHVCMTLKDRVKEHSRYLNIDALILATGYERNKPSDILKPLLPVLDLDDSGHLKIDRHYRVATQHFCRAGIFVQGANERTHGLSDSLLSVLPFRSGDIAEHIYEVLADQAQGGSRHVLKATA